MWHKHLLRQLKRYFGEEAQVPEKYLPLFEAINGYYADSDKDRKLLEHILEVSSQEMIALNTKLRKDLENLEKTEAQIRLVNQRYQSFIAQSTEGIWCIESTQPIYTSSPPEKQIALLFASSLTECNNVLANMHGYSLPEELVGIKLNKLLEITTENQTFLNNFIAANYHISDYTLKREDKDGNTAYYSTSLNGVVENGQLVRVWGMKRDITAWKLAQEKLIQSEARLKASQQIAQVGTWEIDLINNNSNDIDANSTYWSEETFRIYGLNQNETEITSTLFYNLVNSEDRPRLQKEFEDLLKTGKPYNVEHKITLANGTTKTVHEMGVLEYDPITKNPVKIIGTVQDITERKAIQEKILRSETQLKASQRIAKIGSWEHDLSNPDNINDNTLQWSDETYRIFGFEPGTVEVTNELFNSFVHPDDFPKLTAAFNRAITNNETYNVEFRIILPNSSVKTVLEMGEVEYDPKTQKPLRVIGAIQDITEDKEIREKITTSESHLRNSQRIANIGSWEYGLESFEDFTLNTLTWSEETYRIYGYEPNEIEITGDFFMSTVYPLDADSIAEAFQSALTKGEIYSAEHRIVLKDKSVRTVHAMGEFVFDPVTHKPIKMVGTVQDVTAWKKIQDKIQINQSHLNASQRIAKVGSWLVDYSNTTTSREDTPVNWSDENYKIFGVDPSVVATVGLFYKMVHPDDVKMVEAAFAKGEKTGLVDIEYRIITTQGEEKIVEERAEYEFDPKTKKILRVLGTTQDVTDQKKAQQSLKKAEANMRTLLETTNIAYILLDTNIQILTFNQTANQLSREEGMEDLVIGGNYLDWVQNERKKPVLAAIKKVLREKTTLQYEINYEKYKAGKDKWLEVRMLPIVNDDDELLGISISLTDITENKKNERLLKESNDRYIMATKATNDVIWDWDLVNNKFYRSENYGQVFGYPTNKDNLYVTDWVNHIHPEDRERVKRSVEEKINTKGETQWQDEYKFYTASGQIAYVQDKAYIIHNEKGHPTRMVGAMRNITSKKLADLELKKIASDLIQRNKDLEQFAYIVSHNLRAPVANIIGFLQVFNNYSLTDAEKQEYMDGLSLSATKLDEVIMDLNTILNVKREINELKETVKFSELAKDTVFILQGIIKKENINIFTNFTAVNEIITLKSYMASVFYNLISNAIKYRRLDIQTEIEIRSSVENNKIILTFIDNGMGIDLEKKGHQVFGLYKRFHRNVEGKGMGLFMVKTQIETLGGKISIQSQPNVGTQFRIEFEA